MSGADLFYFLLAFSFPPSQRDSKLAFKLRMSSLHVLLSHQKALMELKSVRNDYFDWRTVQSGRGEKVKELGKG